MSIYSTLVLFNILAFSRCQDTSRDYGLCSQVSQMHQYCNGNTVTPSQQTVAGLRGKAGPIGPPGLPGEAASVDYDAIDARINAKFAEMQTETDEKLGICDKKLHQLEESMNRHFPKDCGSASREYAIIWNGTGGVFDIYPESGKSRVYCDLITDGGRWLVFQRRMDGSVDFYRNWTDYASGFGNVAGEFWLGLEELHQISTSSEHELRVDIEDWEGNKRYAKYTTFRVEDAASHYRLTVEGYSGDAGDSMTPRQNGMKFSTKDRDFDTTTTENCAVTYKGAWWYQECHDSNLNGYYFPGGSHESFADGIEWHSWKGYKYSMKFIEMKIRPVV